MNRNEAEKIVRETFENSFNKERFIKFIKNLLNYYEQASFTYQGNYIPDAYKQYINVLERIGKYSDGDNRIDILIVYLKKQTSLVRARTMQRNFIAWYLNGSRGGELKEAALVAYVSPDEDDWRFSLVKMDYKFTEDENGRIKVKEEFTPARRWSFLVGKNEKSHTAQSRLAPIVEDDKNNPALKHFEEAFNVEKVTKEFYIEIAKKFTELTGGERKIGSKKFIEEGSLKLLDIKDEKIRKEFAVRLIGRLIFCWFLNKKKSDNNIPLIPESILSSKSVTPNYYHEILEPLFFQVLNTPIENRRKEFKKELWNSIPFLNGGLFEPEQHDFYDIDKELGSSKYINTLIIPDDWIKKLFEIFELFNFTIDESTSLDIDISIDPEMLGIVFENLLAEINPETGESARKSTGSYYTPRPIVEFMVDESLKEFLKNQTQIEEEKIIKLLSYAENNEKGLILNDNETDIMIDALDSIKILDPACGSGAFPMGILQKMLLILQKIDPQSRKWLSKKIERIDNKILHDELERKLKKENWDYIHKLGIIQNSVYGVDIQPIAVEIAKLRFFLSLVVDEKIEDNQTNRGIIPLPNLEFKFVCANSLIGLPQQIKNGESDFGEAASEIEKLKKLREEYFTSFGKIKIDIEEKFIKIQKSILEHTLQWFKPAKDSIDSQSLKLSLWNPFSNETSEWFDPEWMFGVKNGFDIVIANPPYIRQEELKSIKPILQKQKYEVYNSTSDIYTYFYEKGYQLLKPDGHLTFITSNKWMRAKYGEKLRKFFKLKTLLQKIIDFGGHKVFESATVDTCIVIVQKNNKKCHHNQDFCAVSIKPDFTVDTEMHNYITKHKISMNQTDLDETCFTFGTDAEINLKKKIEKIGKPLKEWDIKIYRGVLTGFNEAFIITTEIKERLCKQDPKSAEILKPILRGRDIHRYYYEWADLWLIKIESGWTNKNCGKTKPEEFFKNTYPSIYNHIISFKNFKGKGKGLFDRDDQGNYWWELRDCNYYPEFEKEKIVWKEIVKEPSFAFDKNGIYCEATTFFMTANNLKYLLGLLNSKAVTFFFKNYYAGGGLGEAGYRYKKAFLELLALPLIKFQKRTITEKIEFLVEQILENSIKQAEVQQYKHQIDQLVYKLYDLTSEEIAIVEGKA